MMQSPQYIPYAPGGVPAPIMYPPGTGGVGYHPQQHAQVQHQQHAQAQAQAQMRYGQGGAPYGMMQGQGQGGPPQAQVSGQVPPNNANEDTNASAPQTQPRVDGSVKVAGEKESTQNSEASTSLPPQDLGDKGGKKDRVKLHLELLLNSHSSIHSNRIRVNLS